MLISISIKKNKIGEVHSFSQLAGSINDKGFASIRVNLASVKTHIEIRDERMKSMLFETDRFPEAVVTTQIVGIQNGLVAMGGLSFNLNKNQIQLLVSYQYNFDNIFDIVIKNQSIPDISNFNTLSFSLVYLRTFIKK